MSSESGFLLANSWLFFPLGLFVAVRIVVSLAVSLVYFWKAHLRRAWTPAPDLRVKYGQWAVITGCTAGIGEQFVHELASQGVNIALVSRSLDKLTRLSTKIEKLYGVKTRIIVSDFLDRGAYKVAAEETQDLDIGLVVNNVGLNTDTASRTLDELSTQTMRNLVVVNGGASTLVTRAFLPRLVARGRGCVLTIGSTLGVVATPHQALYCATKSYLRSLNRAIDDEMQGSGVSVRCNIPQFIRTEMCKPIDMIYNLPLWTHEPPVYVRSSLRTLDTPDTGGTVIFDFMLWVIKALNAVLRPDMEAPVLKFMAVTLLPHCSPA